MKQVRDFLTQKENQQFVLNLVLFVISILLYVFSTEIANYNTTVDEAWIRWKNILMFDFTLVVFSLRKEVKKILHPLSYKVVFYSLLNYFIDQYFDLKSWSCNDYLTVIIIAIEAIIATIKKKKMKEDKSFIELVMVALGGLLLKIKAEVGILLLTFVSFVSPIKGLFVFVGMAVFIDTMAGVYVAKKQNTFCSNNLFNIVVKTFFYMSTILLAYMADKNVLDEKLFGIPFLTAKVTAVFWIYIEGKSLDEKSQKLGNKPFTTIISNLIKWVKSVKKDINEIKE